MCENGSSITLSATPSGGSWSGNDATVATVTSSGVVTGVASGTVSVTYTDAYGGTASVSITVHALPVYLRLQRRRSVKMRQSP